MLACTIYILVKLGYLDCGGWVDNTASKILSKNFTFASCIPHVCLIDPCQDEWKLAIHVLLLCMKYVYYHICAVYVWDLLCSQKNTYYIHNSMYIACNHTYVKYTC